jgi:UDP-N-acetylmuramyl pentapeptide synthase
MNELGNASEDAHRQIGRYCEPKQLDLVVTIGPDANAYLAPEAQKLGCTVASFDDPYSAGEYVRNRMKSRALVLAKGSQNGVYAEEAVKLLLQNSSDANRLVRQSSVWLAKKAKNFGV